MGAARMEPLTRCYFTWRQPRQFNYYPRLIPRARLAWRGRPPKPASWLAQQRAMGGVLHEGMLKKISPLRDRVDPRCPQPHHQTLGSALSLRQMKNGRCKASRATNRRCPERSARRIDRDAVVSPLGRQRTRHIDDASLGGVVSSFNDGSLHAVVD
jgi:hypothetical protein